MLAVVIPKNKGRLAAIALALACGGCATPDMATLSDQPISAAPRKASLANQLTGPSGPSSAAATSPQPLVNEVSPISFVQNSEPPALPPEAVPPRMDYLQQGPTFAPRSLPPVQPTATERMLEMQSRMEQLIADNEQIKQRLARVEGDLTANQGQLAASQQEVETLRRDLRVTQDRMTASYEQFEHLAEQLEANEQSHLKQLDEIISLVRATVRARMMDAVSTQTTE